MYAMPGQPVASSVMCVVMCVPPQVQSPLEKAEKLSEALGNNLLLKREDLQPVSTATTPLALAADSGQTGFAPVLGCGTVKQQVSTFAQ